MSRTQAGNIQQRVQVEDQHAIAEIDQALWEIKNASIDDGRDINDHPAINAHMARSARLHQSRSLLEKVHQNVASSEDSFPSGLRDRVLQHVDQAHRILDRIINQGVAD